MLFEIEFWNSEKYLPTKRHRKLRERYVKNCVNVEIKEITDAEFPIAFIVHDYKSVYDNATSYRDFDGHGDFRMFSEEIRTYKDKLYMPVRITHGSAVSTCFESLKYIKDKLSEREPYWTGGSDFTDASIIKDNNAAECIEKILNKAEDYVIYDGKVWEICGEPMYVINTFGLGHNHGGTGFFIEHFYNENISHENYFNALQRKEAIAYGKSVAANRGDTESIDRIGLYDNIEVLMPNMVKRNPCREHGDGDGFLNFLETMIEGTDSSVEAGLLAVAMCMAAND